MENREEIEWFKKRRDGSPMAGARKMFDMAIAALEKLDAIQTCTPPSDDWEHYADRLHDIAYQSGYEQGKKDAEQDRWIPVTERLPEEEEDVLVTVHFLGLKQTHPNGWNDHIKPSFYVDIAKHYSGEWCSVSDEYKVARSRHIVTAWRPLPAPYQEDKK